MRACLFEDRGAAGLVPLSLTRPVFDLLCGPVPLAVQQLRLCPGAAAGVLVRPELADLVRFERPGLAVNDPNWLRAGPIALINARWLPPSKFRPIPTDRPCVGSIHGEVAFAVVTPELLPVDPLLGLDDCLDRLKRTLPPVAAGGMVIRHAWDLIRANESRLRDEFEQRVAEDDDPVGWRPAGTGLVGPAEKLLIDPLAQIDPMVVFDTTQGPVTVEAGAVVTAFSRLAGPCHVSAGTHVLGARIAGGTTLGPCCRIGGEVESSIVQGFTSKSHDGFLGHSYLGSWVQVAAGAQVSDRRHDYDEVTATIAGHEVPSGGMRLGCLVGDHAKIGIGCLLNAGTVIGAFGQALPAGRLLPKSIPSFCSTHFERLAEQRDFESLLSVAATAMGRRGRALTPAHEDLYRTVYAATAPERRRALRDGPRPRARQAA